MPLREDATPETTRNRWICKDLKLAVLDDDDFSAVQADCHHLKPSL